jgi:plasmid stabilization system protein ParE
MKVRYTDESIDEASDILDYIAKDNFSAAHQVSVAIEDTVSLLQKQPWMSRIVSHGQVRAFPVAGYPYRIFYQITSTEIIIRNIRHMRQQRPWDKE